MIRHRVFVARLLVLVRCISVPWRNWLRLWLRFASQFLFPIFYTLHQEAASSSFLWCFHSQSPSFPLPPPLPDILYLGRLGGFLYGSRRLCVFFFALAAIERWLGTCEAALREEDNPALTIRRFLSPLDDVDEHYIIETTPSTERPLPPESIHRTGTVRRRTRPSPSSPFLPAIGEHRACSSTVYNGRHSIPRGRRGALGAQRGPGQLGQVALDSLGAL